MGWNQMGCCPPSWGRVVHLFQGCEVLDVYIPPAPRLVPAYMFCIVSLASPVSCSNKQKASVRCSARPCRRLQPCLHLKPCSVNHFGHLGAGKTSRCIPLSSSHPLASPQTHSHMPLSGASRGCGRVLAQDGAGQARHNSWAGRGRGLWDTVRQAAQSSPPPPVEPHTKTCSVLPQEEIPYNARPERTADFWAVVGDIRARPGPSCR